MHTLEAAGRKFGATAVCRSPRPAIGARMGHPSAAFGTTQSLARSVSQHSCPLSFHVTDDHTASESSGTRMGPISQHNMLISPQRLPCAIRTDQKESQGTIENYKHQTTGLIQGCAPHHAQPSHDVGCLASVRASRHERTDHQICTRPGKRADKLRT